jgi:hypothetical protein
MNQCNAIITSTKDVGPQALDVSFGKVVTNLSALVRGATSINTQMNAFDLTFLPDMVTRVGKLRDALTSVLGMIATMVDVAFNPADAAGAATTKKVSIMDAFATAIQKGLADAKSYMEAFYTFLNGQFRTDIGALSFVKEVEAFMKTIIDTLKTAEGTVKAAGNAIGVAIGQGIINGLASMLSAVCAAAVAIVNAAIAAAKAAGGVASPSVPFTWQGTQWAAGLALGMDKSQDMVARAASNMVGAAMSGANGAMPRLGGAGGGSVVNNNFNLSAAYGYQSETSLSQDVRMLQMLYGSA